MFRIGKVNVPVMLKILFCRPFGACYLVSLTRGFTPGYVLSALRACCRAKRFFALHEKKRLQNEVPLRSTSESRRKPDLS